MLAIDKFLGEGNTDFQQYEYQILHLCRSRLLNTSPRARLQLAAFETILEILRQRFEIEDVVFQDPAMDELDKTFLGERGYTIVQHPEAQNAMTSTTFLYCPCISWEAVWEFLIVDHPALYYGPKLEDFDSMLRYVERILLILFQCVFLC